MIYFLHFKSSPDTNITILNIIVFLIKKLIQWIKCKTSFSERYYKLRLRFSLSCTNLKNVILLLNYLHSNCHLVIGKYVTIAFL